MSQELEMRITAKVDEALAAIQQLGSQTEEALSQIRDANEKVAIAQERATASARDLITGFSGVLTAGFNLYYGLNRIESANYAVEKAHYLVKKAADAVEDAQRRYNEAVAKYGPESEKAREAAKDLALAQERYELAVERVRMAQNNANQAVAHFALSIVPTMITMIDSGVKAFQSFHAAVDMVNKVTAFLAANPLMAVVMAIGLVIGALITAYQTCEPFRNAINAIGAAIYNFFKPAVDAITGALTWLWKNVVEPFIGTLKRLWDTITGNPILAALFGPITTIAYLIQHWDEVTKALGDTWNAVTSAISRFWNTYIVPIIEFIKSVVMATINAWINVIKWLGDVWNAVASAMSGFWNRYIVPIIDFIKSVVMTTFNIWISIIKSLGDVWNAICSGISWAWNTFVKPVVDAVKWFAETVYGIFKMLFWWIIGGSVWRDLCNGIVAIWNRVVMPLVGTIKSFCEAVVNAFKWLKDTLSGIWNSIVSAAQSAWNSIVSGFQSAWNTISSAVSSAGKAVGDFASTVGNALSNAGQAVWNFVSSICFAHAIHEAVESSVKDLDKWVESVEGAMKLGAGAVKGFASVMKATPAFAFAPAPVGGGVAPPTPFAPRVSAPVTVYISAPLVNVEGSADRRTVELAVEKVKEALKTTLIEATSTGAPTKRIRVMPGVV